MHAINCQSVGKFDEAASIYQQILAVDPNNVDAWHLLGVVACQAGKADDAVRCIDRALQLWPDHHDAHINRGLALKELGRLEEAATSCRRGVELNPTIAQSHYNLGSIYQQQGKLDDAASCFRRALSLQPDHAEALNNLGLALREQGQFDEAASCFRQALALNPTSVESHMNQASLSLLRGDFDHGWQQYEWRWQAGLKARRDPGRPLWDGAPVQGKTVLIYAEQGYGDTLQFIRYATLVKGLGATVLVEEQARMIPLLSTCPGIDRIAASGAELPPFDLYSPLLSLPRLLGTSLETIPAQVPYLFADPTKVAHWREILKEVLGFRIGINWHGREGEGDFRKRDIPLTCFSSLVQIPGVSLISLQRGADPKELAATDYRPPIFDPGNNLDANGAFTDTAAIMMNLDLVITSDTAVPHLAGALGIPVWTALPFLPDWRWLLDRSDSPWYPTMRLFRQPQSGDWNSVFADIRAALTKLIAA